MGRTRWTIGVALTAIAGLGGGGVALLATDAAVAPPAGASALPAFGDCDQLVGYLKSHAEREVGPFGWTYDGPLATAETGTLTSSSHAASAPASASATGSNTQEADVDEPDLAKTDGATLVRVRGGRVETYDLTGADGQATPSATHALPPTMDDPQLLLVGDRVVVSAQVGATPPGPVPDRLLPPSQRLQTRVLTLDLGLRVVDDRTLDGRLITARQYGDVVRLVTSSGKPDLPFVQPGKGLRLLQAQRRNQQIVARSTAADWLPQLTRGGRAAPLVGCDQVRRPRAYSGTDLLAVTAFRPGAPEQQSSVGVLASGDLAYSSADRLYVASQQWRQSAWSRVPVVRDLLPEGQTTTVHEFVLDGLDTRWTASGTVTGTVRDRWSFDEHDHVLRLVVTHSSDDQRSQASSIVMLARRGDRLVQLGRVDGLGRDEEVKSVRFLDDLALVVTFRQVDPLHTVDLGDPAHPRLVGELTVPGFSSYLHPIGDDRLLGLGVDTGATGRSVGAQAAVFSLADLTSPTRLDALGLGPRTYFTAGDDPHAFTWIPWASTAVTSVQTWSGTHDRVVALTVLSNGRLRRTDLGPATSFDQRTLPLGGDRIALVGSTVRVIRLG